MRRLGLILLLISSSTFGDTIENYMKIANNIPQMEMKATPEAQAWAHSARDVLTITSETIAETLIESNNVAKMHASPLFCLPAGTILSADMLNNLIQQTYKERPNPSSPSNLTVSQIAFMAVTQKYPCDNNANTTPQAGIPMQQTSVSNQPGQIGNMIR